MGRARVVGDSTVAEAVAQKETFVERVRLYRSNRTKLLGDVYLTEGRELDLDIADEVERAQLQEVFDQTGDVTWAWTRFGEADWTEHRAEPRTPHWLRFVVLNILYPMGYQADLDVGEDD